MADDLAGWYKAALETAKREGRWPGMAAFEKVTRVSRQQLNRLSKGQRLKQDAVQRIAAALGVEAPRVGAIVAQTGVSAAAVANLRAASAELRAVAERLERVERELTGGSSGAELARAAAVKAKQAGDRAQRRRGDGGGSQSA